MSGKEALVWIRLRGRKIGGWKFRRQHPIGPYFVDFYCPAARLVVEINGQSHQDERAAYDARRQAWLEAEGHYVLRIPVEAIDSDITDVMDTIAFVLAERAGLGFTPRPHRPAAPATSPQCGEELVP